MHGYEFFHGGAGKHFNFFQLPEDLVFNDCFKELSTDAKVLYCIMLKRVGLDALMKDTAAKVSPEKPKAKAKSKKGPEL